MAHTPGKGQAARILKGFLKGLTSDCKNAKGLASHFGSSHTETFRAHAFILRISILVAARRLAGASLPPDGPAIVGGAGMMFWNDLSLQPRANRPMIEPESSNSNRQ
jgi:hypothetical protein